MFNEETARFPMWGLQRPKPFLSFFSGFLCNFVVAFRFNSGGNLKMKKVKKMFNFKKENQDYIEFEKFLAIDEWYKKYGYEQKVEL